MPRFRERCDAIVPITYTEIIRVGDGILKEETQIGEVYIKDLLQFTEQMRKIAGDVRI